MTIAIPALLRFVIRYPTYKLTSRFVRREVGDTQDSP